MRGRKTQIVRTAPKGTIGYCRVSTEDQAREGVSLEAQEARVRAYCSAMDIDLTDVITDAGESAKSLKRPGIARVLERVCSGEIARVVVLKLDRITRSTRDLAEHLDTQSAAGRLVVNMLGVVAQWEREAIAERTSMALGHKRATGRVYGRTPFGYRRAGNNLIADPKQQKALRAAMAMNKQGASLRQIADHLTRMNVKPQGGGKWYAASVKAILTSRMTVGAP